MYSYKSRVVAHRGAGIVAPENTLIAFDVGMKRGFKAMEFDVMLSKDQLPFLMHDEQFGRTVKAEGYVNRRLNQLFQLTTRKIVTWIRELCVSFCIPGVPVLFFWPILYLILLTFPSLLFNCINLIVCHPFSSNYFNFSNLILLILIQSGK